MKKGDTCPHCEAGKLCFIAGIDPYTTDFLMCDNCDSTYVPEET